MQQKIVSPHLGVLLGAALIAHGYSATKTTKGTGFLKDDHLIEGVDTDWTKRSGTEGDFEAHSALFKNLGSAGVAIATSETATFVSILPRGDFAVGAAQELRDMGFDVRAPGKKKLGNDRA